jgi:AMMECR1 domain-containing protein
VIISDSRAASLICLARSTLAELVGGPEDERHPRGSGDVLVNVTVHVHQRLRASMSARGATLEQAVRGAAARAVTDVRFGSALQPGDLPNARLELWIRTASDVIRRADVTRNLDLGLHGIEILGGGSHFAYYKPSVALVSGLTRHERILDKLTKKARLPPGAWRSPPITLRRTTWEHFCEVPADPSRVLHLRRLRPVNPGELTPTTMQARVALAADRLMRVQSSEGHYLYKFHPFTRNQILGPGNLVRQAGCAWALTRAADATAESSRRAELASSASRAIDALLGRVVAETESLFIAEPSTESSPVRGKLGTLALTLAALQSPSLAVRHEGERKRLAKAVLSWQRPDGSFRCRSDSRCVVDDATSQDYFPGQALMALAGEMRAGLKDAQSAMAAALPWYQARFRRQPTTAFVPWQIEAWRLYAEWVICSRSVVEPDARATSQFVFEMADWLLQHQIVSASSHPDLIGGYARGGRKPGCSTATFTQATIGAFSLAQQFPDSNRTELYRRASLLGLNFVRRLQITPDTAILFTDPLRTVGGTTASLSDMTIRCDYDQHTLTAYLAALETCSLL